MGPTTKNQIHKLVVSLVISDRESSVIRARYWSGIHIGTLRWDNTGINYYVPLKMDAYTIINSYTLE